MTSTDDVRILERCDPDLDKHVAMIADEFRQGFLAVESIGAPGVTVFGSARTAEGDPMYELARGASDGLPSPPASPS